jgi:hypothetical protein
MLGEAARSSSRRSFMVEVLTTAIHRQSPTSDVKTVGSCCRPAMLLDNAVQFAAYEALRLPIRRRWWP